MIQSSHPCHRAVGCSFKSREPCHRSSCTTKSNVVQCKQRTCPIRVTLAGIARPSLAITAQFISLESRCPQDEKAPTLDTLHPYHPSSRPVHHRISADLVCASAVTEVTFNTLPCQSRTGKRPISHASLRHVCRNATPVPRYLLGIGLHPRCGYSASMATACGVKCGPSLMEK